MTTDLEKQFFKTFGIEPRQWYKISMGKKGNFYNEPIDKRYPRITDRHYLQLLCLFAKEMNCFTVYDEYVEPLKEAILQDFIIDSECFSKQEVQEIFKD